MKLYKFFLVLIAIPVFLILVWLFAIPTTLIQDSINEALISSGNDNVEIILDDLKKGLFFSLYADTLMVNIDNQPALIINEFACTFAPAYLINREVAFNLKGTIGQGIVDGVLKLPADGKVRITPAELNAVPYISRFGDDIKGHLSSDIELKNETVIVLFEIPDLDITSSALTSIPLLTTYHRIQGSISIKNNSIQFDSVGLEGEKGYARLTGEISNGQMGLQLELMPTAGSLNAGESLLIGRYTVSPGYYVIPITGPLN